MRALAFFPAILAVAFLTSGEARAQISEDDAIEADRLFEEGRALVDAGKIAEGCAALAKSQELDPGAGTLLNLALCHETEGKTEEARIELERSLVLATHDGRDDRATIARAHLEQLTKEEPRRPPPSGLDLVVTAAVFFASGATRLSRVRSRDRDRAPRDNASPSS